MTSEHCRVEREVDLEDLANKAKWGGKRADRALIIMCPGNELKLAIVEDTRRAKLEDFEKLERSRELILKAINDRLLSLEWQPVRVYAIIHSERRLDSMIARIKYTKTTNRIVYINARCEGDVLAKVTHRD